MQQTALNFNFTQHLRMSLCCCCCHRLVQIVLCADSPGSDTLKLYCWDDPSPRTACYNPNPAACQFSYSWAVTPLLASTSPAAGRAGDVLTLRGNALDDIASVWLDSAASTNLCPILGTNSTNITCSIPDMPAGRYKVRAALSGMG